jgi:hypothetical protein
MLSVGTSGKIAKVQVGVSAVRAIDASHFSFLFQGADELKSCGRGYVDPRNIGIFEQSKPAVREF